MLTTPTLRGLAARRLSLVVFAMVVASLMPAAAQAQDEEPGPDAYVPKTKGETQIRFSGSKTEGIPIEEMGAYLRKGLKIS